ncbi:MAG: rhomboid family intramembrane serine protease [Clostridiales bacterium]|nr:rhomboid family intramembrane serine protease [Clostridiales bacterium]
MNLLIIGLNILVFVALEIMGSTTDTEFMLKWGAEYTPWILEGEWYRMFTSMFMHFGFSHLMNNMVLLLFLGDTLEGVLGKWKYLVVYLGGGLAGSLLSLYMDCRMGAWNEMAVSAGASGAVFAVIGGIFIVLIRDRGRIRDMTIGRVLFLIMLTLYHGYQSVGINNAAHLGGVLGGMLLTLILFRKNADRKNRDTVNYFS